MQSKCNSRMERKTRTIKVEPEQRAKWKENEPCPIAPLMPQEHETLHMRSVIDPSDLCSSSTGTSVSHLPTTTSNKGEGSANLNLLCESLVITLVPIKNTRVSTPLMTVTHDYVGTIRIWFQLVSFWGTWSEEVHL